jgi:hypothetical protein
MPLLCGPLRDAVIFSGINESHEKAPGTRIVLLESVSKIG